MFTKHGVARPPISPWCLPISYLIIHNDFVCGLCLAISMDMMGVEYLFFILSCKVPPKGLAIKLKAIIRDKSVRNPKPRYNICHTNLFMS